MKNILRQHRKSKGKKKAKKYILFIFTLIMTTFAWFAYSKVLNSQLNMHVAAWDMEYFIGEEKKENPIGIDFPTLYPHMPEQTVTVDIMNNGEALVDLNYNIQAISIAGVSYELVPEGKQPTTENYINIEKSVVEEKETGEVVAKGKIINDTTKFPFTLEIEHSAQVSAKNKAYLKVTANWAGDNDELDSKWGYTVGKYFMDNPKVTSAMSVTLSIDSYQANEEIKGGTVKTAGTYLPTGFTQVEGTTLENGLTIQDSSGNQYVWIEVPKTEKVYPTAGLKIRNFTDEEYTKIENDLHTYTSVYRNGTTYKDEYYSDEATGLTREKYTELKKKMLKSVYQNGGFYIGKYETGYETGIEAKPRTSGSATITPNELPIIKQNAYPYNYVTCSQAQKLANMMESGSYNTSLMFGVQWDLVLKHLENKGVKQSLLKNDSKTWGNYTNNLWSSTNADSKYAIAGQDWVIGPYGEKNVIGGILLSTGASDTFSKQGIYDLAGNVWEWTLEYTTNPNYPSARRGGCNFNIGAECTATSRNNSETSDMYRSTGFRTALY